MRSLTFGAYLTSQWLPVANADIPPLRFHDLRHAHGSLLIKQGTPVKVVSERHRRNTA